jgi:hypothetical protein
VPRERYGWYVEIVIAIVVLVVVVLVMGAAPMIRRLGSASEDRMKARMPRGMDVDVERDFKRPRDEGNLL